MSDFKITCQRCKCDVEHVCNTTLREELLDLLTWVPEGGMSGDAGQVPGIIEAAAVHDAEYGNTDPFYRLENMPFFGSQSWSYFLFYKGEARSFHALLRNVIRAAGLDPHELEMEAHKRTETRIRQEKHAHRGQVVHQVARWFKKNGGLPWGSPDEDLGQEAVSELRELLDKATARDCTPEAMTSIRRIVFSGTKGAVTIESIRALHRPIESEV